MSTDHFGLLHERLDQIEHRIRIGSLKDVAPDRDFLSAEVRRQADVISRARAACALLGPLATGVLAVLDGDQALQDPYRRSADA